VTPPSLIRLWLLNKLEKLAARGADAARLKDARSACRREGCFEIDIRGAVRRGRNR